MRIPYLVSTGKYRGDDPTKEGVPSGLEAGDVVIAFITGTSSAPTGWTLVPGASNSAGGTSTFFAICYKVLTDENVDIAHSTGYIIMAAYRDCDPTAPIEVVGSLATATSPDITVYTDLVVPSITTLGQNSLVLLLAHNYEFSYDYDTLSTWWTTPVGPPLSTDILLGPDALNHGLGIWSMVQPSAGPVPSSTISVEGTKQGRYISLRASSSGPRTSVDTAHASATTTNVRLPNYQTSKRKYHGASDAALPRQYSHLRSDVFSAWKYTMGHPDFLVTVNDSGLIINSTFTGPASDPTLGVPGGPLYPTAAEQWPAFAGKKVIRFNPGKGVFGPSTDNSAGSATHGTCCSGVILANANKPDYVGSSPLKAGPVGVAPECSLFSCNGFSWRTELAPGETYVTIVALTEGLIMGSLLGAKISNNSWGSAYTSTGGLLAEYRTTFDLLRDRGDAALFAACNYSTGMSGSPGNLCKEYGFLSVGCLETTRLDERACYSNYGPKVNAVAHGHQILASVYHQAGTGIATSGAIDSDFEWFTPSNPNNALVDYTYFNGTSSATPFSVGICALIGSANMDLTGLQICQIAKDTWDKPQNPDFTTLFPELPGIWNAGKAVSKALSLVPEFAGHIFPYCNFFKRDIMGRYIPILISDAVVWSSGVPTVHLHGTIYVELIAYSSDPITSLELWAGSTMVYQGGARTTWDSLIPLNSGLLAGNLLKLVARTSTLTVEQEYVDVIGHTSAAAAPLTTVSWPTATRGTIILSSVSENAPVTIRYRWGSGAWSTYLAPLTPQSGKLQFYGIDISGNIEGGVYDPV